MAVLPTYGDCDCGGRLVLDVETIDGPGYIRFRCDAEDCDWAKAMAESRFEAAVEQSESVSMDDLRAQAQGGAAA